MVESAVDNKRLIALSSTGHGEEKIGRTGLVSGHAYTILHAKEGGGERLVCIRNPWGKGEWKGDWSDKSPKWTWRMEKIFKPSKNSEDGQFWMSFYDVLKYFVEIDVCYLDKRKCQRIPVDIGTETVGRTKKCKYTVLKIQLNSPVGFLGVFQETDREHEDYIPICMVVHKLKAGRHERRIKAKTRTGRQPVDCWVQHSQFEYKNVDWGVGQYEITIFTPGRRLEANENRDIALSFHFSGKKPTFTQEIDTDESRITQILVDMAKQAQPEYKMGKRLATYNHEA
eukprot:UN28977